MKPRVYYSPKFNELYIHYGGTIFYTETWTVFEGYVVSMMFDEWCVKNLVLIGEL